MDYHQLLKTYSPVLPEGSDYRNLVVGLLWTDGREQLQDEIDYLQYELEEKRITGFPSENAPVQPTLHHFYFSCRELWHQEPTYVHPQYYVRQTFRIMDGSEPQATTKLYYGGRSALINDFDRLFSMGLPWPMVLRIINLCNDLSARAFDIGIKLLRPAADS